MVWHYFSVNHWLYENGYEVYFLSVQQENVIRRLLNMFVIFEESVEDRDEFCSLYEKANAVIYKRVFAILKNKQDTEDALQDTWLKIMKNFDKIKKQSCDRKIGFVCIVAKNTAIDIYNKKKKVINVDNLEAVAPDNMENLENIVVSKIESDGVISAVSYISDTYKNPLILKYIYSFSNKEIAEILNISETNVSTRLSRAKTMLKDTIIKRDGGYERY